MTFDEITKEARKLGFVPLQPIATLSPVDHVTALRQTLWTILEGDSGQFRVIDFTEIEIVLELVGLGQDHPEHRPTLDSLLKARYVFECTEKKYRCGQLVAFWK